MLNPLCKSGKYYASAHNIQSHLFYISCRVPYITNSSKAVLCVYGLLCILLFLKRSEQPSPYLQSVIHNFLRSLVMLDCQKIFHPQKKRPCSHSKQGRSFYFLYHTVRQWLPAQGHRWCFILLTELLNQNLYRKCIPTN